MEEAAALGVGTALGSQGPLPSRKTRTSKARWAWGVGLGACLARKASGAFPGPCPSTREHSLPLQQASRVTEVRPPPEGDPLPGWGGRGREWGDRRREDS